MSLCCLSVISSDGTISSHYHWLKGDIVRPILTLAELFCERITKSGEVERPKEKIKQVELPDEEERLEEVEHDELPDEGNKKKLEREKAGGHPQRMVWTGKPEKTFLEIVTDLGKNGSKNLFPNLKLQILSFIKCLMIVKITSYSASYVLFVV